MWGWLCRLESWVERSCVWLVRVTLPALVTVQRVCVVAESVRCRGEVEVVKSGEWCVALTAEEIGGALLVVRESAYGCS